MAQPTLEHLWEPAADDPGSALQPVLEMTIRYRTVDSNLVAGPVAGFLWPSAKVLAQFIW